MRVMPKNNKATPTPRDCLEQLNKLDVVAGTATGLVESVRHWLPLNNSPLANAKPPISEDGATDVYNRALTLEGLLYPSPQQCRLHPPLAKSTFTKTTLVKRNGETFFLMSPADSASLLEAERSAAGTRPRLGRMKDDNGEMRVIVFGVRRASEKAALFVVGVVNRHSLIIAVKDVMRHHESLLKHLAPNGWKGTRPLMLQLSRGPVDPAHLDRLKEAAEHLRTVIGEVRLVCNQALRGSLR
jgi:hypothetical protein